MKIGIDARFYRKETAGIGRYTRGLLSNLAKLDKKNDYYIFLTPEDMKEYDIKADNFHPISIDITHYTLLEQTKFLSILNSHNFDLVHFLNFNHPILYNKPFITTVHDLTMLLFPVGRSQKSLLRKIAFKKVLTHACQKAKKVIAISEATKNDIIKYLGGKKDNIDVIYEAYDDIYNDSLSIKEIDKVKQKYNIDKPYLLFVSQWRPHKGLPELIKSFEFLKQKYNIKEKLVITGNPNNDFPQIIDSIKKSKFSSDIVTPGFVDEKDLPILYKGTKAFIFPSFYEGFGLGPLEAMACGAPVISSKLSAMPEILGSAPLYFDPSNLFEMSEQIYKVINDEKLRKQMIDKGFIQAKKYSWIKMTKETLKLYNSID